MWTLKNSKDLLEYIQSRSLSSCNSIKTLELSTLYTAIPHSQLNDKLRELVQLCFIKKYLLRRNKYLVLGKDTIILLKSSLNLISSTYSSFWLTTYLLFGGRDFQQVTGSRHTYVYNLWSSSLRLVPLFVWGRFHTGDSQEKRKEASPIS